MWWQGKTWKKLPLDEVELVAVDFETTSTNPRTGRVVSAGWVTVRGGAIDLSTANYHLVAGGEVGDSALVHGITDDALEGAQSWESVRQELTMQLQGRFLLAHFAPLEVGFLGHRGAVVDTFALERRHMERMATYPRGEDLRLARARQRYGLPSYGNHNALSDALACAELYLAQLTRTKSRVLADVATYMK